jgi:hypothetical protein
MSRLKGAQGLGSPMARTSEWQRPCPANLSNVSGSVGSSHVRRENSGRLVSKYGLRASRVRANPQLPELSALPRLRTQGIIRSRAADCSFGPAEATRWPRDGYAVRSFSDPGTSLVEEPGGDGRPGRAASWSRTTLVALRIGPETYETAALPLSDVGRGKESRCSPTHSVIATW